MTIGDKKDRNKKLMMIEKMYSRSHKKGNNSWDTGTIHHQQGTTILSRTSHSCDGGPDGSVVGLSGVSPCQSDDGGSRGQHGRQGRAHVLPRYIKSHLFPFQRGLRGYYVDLGPISRAMHVVTQNPPHN